jgi:hypothetical protein
VPRRRPRDGATRVWAGRAGDHHSRNRSRVATFDATSTPIFKPPLAALLCRGRWGSSRYANAFLWGIRPRGDNATRIIAAIRLSERDPARLLQAALRKPDQLAPNRATGLDLARHHPAATPLAGGARAKPAAVVSNIPPQRSCQLHLLQVTTRRLQEQVSESQMARRNFFIRGNCCELTIGATRRANTHNLAFRSPYFFCWSPAAAAIPLVCEQRRYPDALGAGDGTAAPRRATHGCPRDSTRAHDRPPRNGPRDWGRRAPKNAPTSAMRTAGWGMAACEPTQRASVSAHCRHRPIQPPRRAYTASSSIGASSGGLRRLACAGLAKTCGQALDDEIHRWQQE